MALVVMVVGEFESYFSLLCEVDSEVVVASAEVMEMVQVS
jgi:hypothetical protein